MELYSKLGFAVTTKYSLLPDMFKLKKAECHYISINETIF